ncbi:MAG: 2'-deoxycytidine 5'-triphosphate deaminase, partial [Rhodomicrobium sp.]
IGYRAKRHTGVIDVDRAGAYDLDEFWEPLMATPQKRLILDPDEFYILASKEAVLVPPTHAAEMEPFNALMGEFRVHYAGFFDPGFGLTETGGHGSRAVLEVRSHKVPFILEDGQMIGRLIYEPLSEPPAQLYGREIGSHYQAQALKLSKHFR